MATLALKMDSNPFFEYFMKLLAPSLKKRNKQALAILQNPMAYYACHGIKRSCGTYSQDIRNKKACESYQGHVVPAFFIWMEDRGHKLPSWVSKELMGQSTLNGEYKNK